MPAQKLLVIAKPNARFLARLDQLPDSVHIVAGDTPEAFEDHAEDATVALNCFTSGKVLRAIWHRAHKLAWVHSLSAGLDKVLFPELAESGIPMTNSRGVFAQSLGEFAIGAILFFAKDLRRMVRNQAAAHWEAFDIDMISGKTLGVVGYGAIGHACAWRAKALGMRVAALRRRPGAGQPDGIADMTFGPDGLGEMLAISDYVLVSAALTAETTGLIGEPQLAAMKPGAVIINVGRGPVIVENALVRALEQRRIRGAALDVFDTEPLPPTHPFWRLDNVLLSPHCADHTATWLDEAMDFFVENFRRFDRGEPLRNLVDKRAGY